MPEVEPPGLEPGPLYVENRILPHKLWPHIPELEQNKANIIKFRLKKNG